jgi:hypothetical protein
MIVGPNSGGCASCMSKPRGTIFGFWIVLGSSDIAIPCIRLPAGVPSLHAAE